MNASTTPLIKRKLQKKDWQISCKKGQIVKKIEIKINLIEITYDNNIFVI